MKNNKKDSRKLVGKKKIDHHKKIQEIKHEIKNRFITMEQILDLNLTISETLWFYEHIELLSTSTLDIQEKLALKNNIYNKYKYAKMFAGMNLNTSYEQDIAEKIIKSSYSDSIKMMMYKKLMLAEKDTTECGKIIEWINIILDLPVQITTPKLTSSDIEMKLRKLWTSLNKNISGLPNVKEKIMESMCTKLMNTKGCGKVITLAGSPGVGKTIIAYAIAESMNMAFDQISFGAINDCAMLIGHSSAYIGSTVGLFTKILLKSQNLETLVLCDEFDKIPKTSNGDSIVNVMIHATDRAQNHRFKDMYIPEIELNLSRLFYVMTVNDKSLINPIMLDRMTIIDIDGYNLEEKINIVEQHILPRILNELNFNKNDIVIDKKTIIYIINKTPPQDGMRNIERSLYQICEKLILLKYCNNINVSYSMPNIKFPLKLTSVIIDKLLVN